MLQDLFRHNLWMRKVPFGAVEAVNGSIKALLRRHRGYRNLRDLLLKVQQMAASKSEFVVMRRMAQKAGSFAFATVGVLW